MVLKRFEYSIYGIIASLAVIDLILLSQNPMRVDWEGYGPTFLFGFGLIALGHFYRHYRKVERIASVLIGTGAFVSFTLVASVFNYLLLPIQFPRIDQQLFALDAFFGYSWVSMVEWAAGHPGISKVLYHVYFSSLPQLILIVLLLGFSGRIQALWEFLSVGILGVLFCMGIWFFFPSFGPTTIVALPSEWVEAAGLGVTPSYGAALNRVAIEGEAYLTPHNVLGLIAFPSFHMVMAAMAMFYLWPIPWLKWVALLINVAMVPAILIHGGHHAVDVPAGFLVFLFVYFVVKKIRNIDYLSTRRIVLLN
jgi:hypothetical protein